MQKFNIPKEVLGVVEALEGAGFEAYIVGGCVRDLLLNKKPKDWDVCTSAKPEEIQKLFAKSFYENRFGTVSVVTDSEDPTLKTIEITPFRLEAKYSDKRHPDEVSFGATLKEDLARRDFTINAIALKFPISKIQIIDYFGGQKDLQQKLIRAVGNPEERFDEDALRMMRAVRLATELEFKIEETTQQAIIKKADLLRMIAKERIRDEFIKIIMSDRPDKGIEQMHELGILKHIVPELEEGIGVKQNKAHVYTVWEHSLRSLMHAVRKKWPLDIRLAVLLHDVAKPRTKRGEGPDCTFYGHEVVGAKMTARILSRLKFPKKFTEKVVRLVRYHLFFSDTDVITLSAVRRIIRNVGPENIWDLMKVRFSDRTGMGRPKEAPYRLRKYEVMIEQCLRDPISVGMLKVNGNDVMKLAGIDSGPRVGYILHALLEEVLDDPSRNTKEYLEGRIRELAKLPDEQLRQLGERGKEKKAAIEEEKIAEIKKKYCVR